MTLLTLVELRQRLIMATKAAGGIRPWAEMHHIHPSVVDHFLRGQRGPAPQVLKALGAKRIVRFEIKN